VTKPEDTKAARKASAAAAGDDKGVFEETAFGRRRISKVPKPLSTLGSVIAFPFVFISRRLRGSRDV